MTGRHSLFGPVDPAADAGYDDHLPRKGFFTDTSICIGCKACEVACKEWNDVPADHFEMLGSSYDNSFSLNANQWRHVAFIEQPRALGDQEPGLRQPTPPPVELGMPEMGARGDAAGSGTDDEKPDFRWLMSSDVCKHCTHAAARRVPDRVAVPHRVRTVVVQEDICNGCGYCVPACPYGVIERRKGHGRQERRHRPEVHALLRPARRRPDAGVREGLPDPVDPVRRRRGAAGAGEPARREAARGRHHGRPALRQRPRTTGSAGPGVLPAARQARGLRLPARPRRDDQGPARDVRHAGAAAVALLAGAAVSFLGRRR